MLQSRERSDVPLADIPKGSRAPDEVFSRDTPTRGNDVGQHVRRCCGTLAAEVPLAAWKRSINQDILKS